MNSDSSKNQVLHSLKEPLNSARDSFTDFFEEKVSKWRIGRRNFP